MGGLLARRLGYLLVIVGISLIFGGTVETTAADVSTTNATTEAPAVISTATSTETIVTSINGSDISTPEPGTEPTTQSTAEPTTTPTPTPSHCDPSRQHFDAASFIGGIVLCGAVIAIAFFGCKFYKQRSETKYQQF